MIVRVSQSLLVFLVFVTGAVAETCPLPNDPRKPILLIGESVGSKGGASLLRYCLYREKGRVEIHRINKENAVIETHVNDGNRQTNDVHANPSKSYTQVQTHPIDQLGAVQVGETLSNEIVTTDADGRVSRGRSMTRGIAAGEVMLSGCRLPSRKVEHTMFVDGWQQVVVAEILLDFGWPRVMTGGALTKGNRSESSYRFSSAINRIGSKEETLAACENFTS